MWDIKSVILYLIMAYVGYICIKKERRLAQKGYKNNFKYSYWILFGVWMIFSVFRYVGYENGILVGGQDAPTYIDYFQNCLSDSVSNLYSYRTEPLFQWFTKVVRYITDDYHVYFALIYGFIIVSYLVFIEEFDLFYTNKATIFMLFFPFLQSFSAVRTHITIALILIAIVALHKKKNILAGVLCVATVFIQRSSIIYAIFPIFYFYYNKNKMTIKKAILFIVIGSIVGYVGRGLLIGGSIEYFTGGVYANYASASYEDGYFLNYIKLILEQIVIDVWMILSSKKINRNIIEMDKSEGAKLQMFQIMCYFDLMLVPVCYIAGIWRGVNYFFVPRLLMFCYLLTMFSKKITRNSRDLYNVLIFIGMVIWLVLRLSTVYDVSGLMPYYFDICL